MSHSFFSPSSAHRWIKCPGSMAFAPNQVSDGSSTYADDGTASHHWGALCLTNGKDPKMAGEDANAECFIGEVQTINGKDYEMDEERAGYVQMYIDDVRRRAMGGILFVEYHVDLSRYLGEGQGGTGDAVIILPRLKTLIVEDLKYGTGERVEASYMVGDVEKPNEQLGLYALGALEDARMLGYEINTVILVVCQPRLNHISEAKFTPAQLTYLADEAVTAVKLSGDAMILATDDPKLAKYLAPAPKTCRWCRVQATCPALAKFVADEVRADFDTIEADPPPHIPNDAAIISRAAIALPLIKQWCQSVHHALHTNVAAGMEINGPDGLPFKFVEGDMGKRQWIDEAAAETALQGVLSIDKVYKPREVITAPAAGKLLDKKATKEMWKDVFTPMIHRAPGKPVLTIGSDTRAPYTGGAAADEFDELGVES